MESGIRIEEQKSARCDNVVLFDIWRGSLDYFSYLQFVVNMVRQYWKPLTLLLLIIITWLSLRTPDEVVSGIPGIDKLQHLIAYAALAFPVVLAKPRSVCVWLMAMLLWSGGIELIQPIVGRERDLADFLCNSAGLALAFLLSNLIWKITPLTTNRLSDAC